jgi:hypothetical protein
LRECTCMPVPCHTRSFAVIQGSSAKPTVGVVRISKHAIVRFDWLKVLSSVSDQLYFSQSNPTIPLAKYPVVGFLPGMLHRMKSRLWTIVHYLWKRREKCDTKVLTFVQRVGKEPEINANLRKVSAWSVGNHLHPG